MASRRHDQNAWLFIAFPLVVIFVFTALPAVAGFALSFFEWSGGGAPRFIGLENYSNLFTSSTFGSALRNTLIFAIVTVPVTVIFAFVIGCALSAEWFHGRTAARTILFIPTIISIVAIGFIWRWMLDPGAAGLLNHVLLSLGVPRASLPDWLGDSPWGLATIMMVSIWRGLGFSIVLYLAAITSVPRSLHEAAAIDGAGPWRAMWTVTWPTVRPMTYFLLITGMIGALQVFDIIVVMIGTIEQDWTDVLNLYVYREFVHNRLGFAAAIGVVILVLAAAITIAQLYWIRTTQREALA